MYYTYVYFAQHPDGSRYYGYTKNLENRIKEHVKNYNAPISHSSVDYLAVYSRKTGIPPRDWKYYVIDKFDNKDDARILKSKLVRGDKRSINYFYKHTTRKPKGVE